MQSPRFLGSRLLFWLVMPWLVLGIVAISLVAQGCFEHGQTTQGIYAIGFVLFCVLGLYAMLSRKHGRAVGRTLALAVPVAYLWYFAHTYFVEGQSLNPTGRRSDSTPFNAICGFVVFGLPCLFFALTGRPFWGACKEEPNQSSAPSSTVPPSSESRGS